MFGKAYVNSSLVKPKLHVYSPKIPR